VPFAPLRLDGGGCAQVIAQSPDGKSLLAGADTQGFYLSQTVPLATKWTVQNTGIGKSTFWRQCATLLWSSTETGVIYAGVGDNGNGGGLLAGTLTGTYPAQSIKWALRSAAPGWAGNHATAPVPTGSGISRPAGHLLAQDASFLYAGTYKLGVLRSSNTGGASNLPGADNFPVACTMAGAAPGTNNWFCFSLVQDPVGTDLYAGFFDSTGTAAGLWHCANPHAGAPNFTQVAGGPAMCVDLAVVGGYLYVAGGNQGLYRYGPLAGSPAWQALNGATIPTAGSPGLANNYWSSVAGYVDGSANHVILIADNNTQGTGTDELYTATVPSNYPTGSISYATNGTTQTATEPPGYTWWHSGSSYKNWFGGKAFFQPNVLVDASNLAAVNVYCAGSEGCARSINGAQWAIANSGMPQFLGHPVAASPTRAGHVVFGDSDFCVWDDTNPGAENASTLQNDPPVNSTQGFSVAFSADGNTVYAGNGQKYTNAGGGVWSRAWNQPNTWTELGFKTAAGGKVAIGLAAFNDAGGNKIVLAAAWGSGMWRYAPTGTGGAYQWTRVNAAIGVSGSGTLLAVTYAGNGLVFAYDRGSGVYRSADYGKTWVLVWNKTSNSYQAGTAAYDPTRPGKLWVSTATGLYLLNGGSTGTVTGGNITPVLSTALPGKNGPIAFDAAGNLYCALQDTGNGSGLVRSPDSGATWADVVGDGSFAQCNSRPELIAISPVDNRIYVSGSNVVATGFAGGGAPPPPGSSSSFTPVQTGVNIGANQGVLNLFLPSPSAVGTMLLARLVTTDQGATITAPAGWVLVADQSSGTGTGVTRAMIWAYYNNPGGLATAGSTAAILRGVPQPAAPGAATPPSTTGGPRVPGAASAAPGGGGGGLILGGAQVASGGAVTFTSSNTGTPFKGKLTEFSTPAGTVQAADQTGGASGTTSATSLPVTASAANAYTGGMAAAMFGASLSPAPTGQSWTTPSGWAQDGIAVNTTLAWSQYSQEGITAGPTTVTGTINPGSGGTMTSWAAALATFYAIVTSAVSITTASCPNGTVNVAYSKTLHATGGALPYSWALASGTLPTGLTLSAGGVLSGTPTVAGTYSFTVQVTDSAAQTATASYTVTISGALSVTTASLPNGTTGAAYSQSLAATGGKPSYSWAVTAGSLPSGLGLSAAGAITGTPLLAGTSSFTAGVTDTLGATATAALSITVTTGPLTVTTQALAAASLGLRYTAALAATGGTPPYTWAVTAGSLPPGITMGTGYPAVYGPVYAGPPDGTLSGTPTAQGTYTFTATVTDSASATASVSLTITVSLRLLVPPAAGPWRILYGPTQPTGGVTGEVLQAQNKTITLRTEPDQNHEVSFDADGRSPAIAGITELETDIIVMYGSRIIFDGRVVPTQDTLTASAHRTVVTALDYREVLRRRAVYPGDQLSWTNTDQAIIAWNMIQATQARPGGNLGIARGAGASTGVTRTQTNTLGDYIGDGITNLAKLNNGFEWQITPYGFADLRFDVFYPQQGVNNGVVLAWGDARISSITRNVDPSTFADAVYVTGNSANSLTAQHLEAADIATRAEQRWDLVIGTQDNTQSTLNDDATALLNQAQVVVPSYTVVFYPGAWSGPSDIWLGDTVTVQIDSGRLEVNDSLRVVEMSFAISSDNVETLTLTVGAIPFRLHRAIPKILKAIRYLKTR
jgi:hypothetical protein